MPALHDYLAAFTRLHAIFTLAGLGLGLLILAIDEWGFGRASRKLR